MTPHGYTTQRIRSLANSLTGIDVTGDGAAPLGTKGQELRLDVASPMGESRSYRMRPEPEGAKYRPHVGNIVFHRRLESGVTAGALKG